MRTMSWEREDTERWLNDYPLPPDFTWRGEHAWPRYQLKGGYGKWLREAGPYHVALRGLFALVHDILVSSDTLPSSEQLAAQLKAYEAMQGSLPIDDQPAATHTPPAA